MNIVRTTRQDDVVLAENNLSVSIHLGYNGRLGDFVAGSLHGLPNMFLNVAEGRL
jgi:hypothetical protein